MKQSLLIVTFVCAAFALSFSGCLGDNTDANPSTGTPAGATPTPTPTATPTGPTPTPTPTPSCLIGNSSGWYDPTARVAYVDNATTTISSVTVYIAAMTTTTGAYSLTLDAFACGPGGTQVGTASASPNLALRYQNVAVTFTFASAIAVQNCGGKGTVAFKMTNNTGPQVGMASLAASGSSCGILVGNDNTTTPPTNPSGNAYIGTITP